MGTVMNGKKWAGACVNGKTVSGLVKNGVVFYRKPISTYKRRIMSTDNLEGKTIFFDFPDNYGDIITTPTRSFLSFWELYFSDGTSLGYLIIRSAGARTITLFDEQLKINIKQLTVTGEFGKLYKVIDCESYRHCWIEDENIRPLEVGDVITSNTKLYFTFPDDFSKNFSPQMAPILTGTSSDGSASMYLWYSQIVGTYNVYFNFIGMSGYSQENIYTTNSDGNVSKNISYINLNVTKSITIDDINNIDIVKHILVDTTTLGA